MFKYHTVCQRLSEDTISNAVLADSSYGIRITSVEISGIFPEISNHYRPSMK